MHQIDMPMDYHDMRCNAGMLTEIRAKAYQHWHANLFC